MIILSILIATTPDREPMTSALMSQLYKQIDHINKHHSSLGNIEVLFDDAPRFLDGGPSIGAKRDSLKTRADGKYLCYLDSDESIAPNYVETLVRLCHRNADVVTFRNISKMDTFWMTVDMRLNYPNDQACPDFEIRRKPWHICPVRTEFAKLYKFIDANYSEDWTWMENVLKHCTTEAHTDAILHQYNHSSKTSEADKIINAGYA